VFCGVDFCGKTTHSQGLVDRLCERGEAAEWTREPGSPHIALNVRDFALSLKQVSPWGLELLFNADRADHLKWVGRQLDAGTTVVSDRSFLSGLAYGLARGLRYKDLAPIYKMVITRLPDHIFFLDTPLEIIERRMNRTQIEGGLTREEVKGMEHMRDVRKTFLRLIEAPVYDPFFAPLKGRITIINTDDKSIEETAKIIDEVVGRDL